MPAAYRHFSFPAFAALFLLSAECRQTSRHCRAVQNSVLLLPKQNANSQNQKYFAHIRSSRKRIKKHRCFTKAVFLHNAQCSAKFPVRTIGTIFVFPAWPFLFAGHIIQDKMQNNFHIVIPNGTGHIPNAVFTFCQFCVH